MKMKMKMKDNNVITFSRKIWSYMIVLYMRYNFILSYVPITLFFAYAIIILFVIWMNNSNNSNSLSNLMISAFLAILIFWFKVQIRAALDISKYCNIGLRMLEYLNILPFVILVLILGLFRGVGLSSDIEPSQIIFHIILSLFLLAWLFFSYDGFTKKSIDTLIIFMLAFCGVLIISLAVCLVYLRNVTVIENLNGKIVFLLIFCILATLLTLILALLIRKLTIVKFNNVYEEFAYCRNKTYRCLKKDNKYVSIKTENFFNIFTNIPQFTLKSYLSNKVEESSKLKLAVEKITESEPDSDNQKLINNLFGHCKLLRIYLYRTNSSCSWYFLNIRFSYCYIYFLMICILKLGDKITVCSCLFVFYLLFFCATTVRLLLERCQQIETI